MLREGLREVNPGGKALFMQNAAGSEQVRFRVWSWSAQLG